jgi:hypothetical protein
VRFARRIAANACDAASSDDTAADPDSDRRDAGAAATATATATAAESGSTE